MPTEPIELKPPSTIYLQWYGDGEPKAGPCSHDDVTWCKDRTFPSDIEYTRAESVNAELLAACEAVTAALESYVPDTDSEYIHVAKAHRAITRAKGAK